jgi:hypothetical protein
MVERFAQTQPDLLIRKALAIQGYEEGRHARLFREFVRRYGIDASARDEAVAVTRQAFIDFGCRECLHAFLGFGAYRLAMRSQILPAALMKHFTRLMREEARHVVFFVNWLAYERVAGHGWTAVPLAPAALGYARVMVGLIRGAPGAQTRAEGLPGVGRALAGMTPALFLQTCLSENEREMARFDPRLLRPQVMPEVARLALRLIERVSWAQEVSRVLGGTS